MTQGQALEILKMGQNVFLTGSAGTGKTHLLNEYIEYLKKNKISVAITASTGIAATHMDGRTIHSWSAIGIKSNLTKKEFNAIIYNEDIQTRINKAKVLIVDEISMLDAKRFDLIELICRTVRKKSSPFGGLQVILCGDFFQLPPVPTRGEPPPEFAFDSLAWGKLNIIICYLEKQYRQEDGRFLNLLNDIRNSKTTLKTREILMERHQKSVNGVPKPTKLYATNRKVNALNDFELSRIASEEHVFNMSWSGDSELVNELKKTCLAPDPLILKKDAFVMFVKNNYIEGDTASGYVNGTLGIITGFNEDDGFPIVKKQDGKEIIATPRSWTIEEDEIELARITQVPLRLAWAITIHKSQGMSLDCAEIDLGSAFTQGMGYVALSRVRKLEGIKLMGLNELSLIVNSVIKEIDVEFKRISEANEEEIKLMDSDKKKELIKVFLHR
jgi:ATP-dependent exoDNAse (exonuclease V) alpha subunit